MARIGTRVLAEIEEFFGRLPAGLTIPAVPLALGPLLRTFLPFAIKAKRRVVAQQKRLPEYLASEAATGPHLADQLLLPLALARGGRFTTLRPTPHTRSNIAVIEKFLPVEISVGDTRHGERLIKVAL